MPRDLSADDHDNPPAHLAAVAADIDALAASMTGPDALAEALHQLGSQSGLFAALDNLLLAASTRSRGVPDRDSDQVRLHLRYARNNLARAANDIAFASEYLTAPGPPSTRAAPRDEAPVQTRVADSAYGRGWARPGPAAARAAIAAARTTAEPEPEPRPLVRPAPWAATTAQRHRRR
ncbi:hypothetical protein [Embleya sp. NPDC059259]|uniref:hypothetical protein n=1 Tax=unclassified Embleya TaxID=2699296 RepID=UPI0036A6200C